MRDGSAGNDHKLPSEAEGASAPAVARPPQEAARNLTQELAQLLAASIAQNQAAKGQPVGVPTNSDLASLASIVSAASGQRTLAPVFKDGLSSLAYTPARQTLEAPSVSFEAAHDDEPMPIPSTWREPRVSDDDRWYRQQMGAAFLGLLAGLLIVVPTVLWLSGFFDPQKAKVPAVGQQASAADAKSGEVRTLKVQVQSMEKSADAISPYVTGSIAEPRAAVEARHPAVEPPAPTMTTATLVDPKVRVDELLGQAARRIEAGDVTGAREVLGGSDDGTQGAVTFALAETYDPNMLAAWGARGVAADVARAKALYRKALGLGMARAQPRLDALR